jgi:hypothetical protein
MSSQTTAKIGFSGGLLFFIGGELLLCYCPVPFLIAAALFALPAVYGRGILRPFALVMILASLAMSVYEFKMEKEVSNHLRKAAKQAAEQREQGTNPVTSDKSD